MTRTILSSATKEVIIGFDQPFVIIGERINPTGRKILAAEMTQGNFKRVEADALAQVAAGAQMLDVNAGIPLADEPAILAQCIQLVQSITDVPLTIDSSIVAALEAGLAVYQGKALVNSVTGEDEVLDAVLPLVAKYKAASSRFQTTKPGSPKIPMCGLTSQRKLLSGQPTMAFRFVTLSLTPWSCPLAPSTSMSCGNSSIQSSIIIMSASNR